MSLNVVKKILGYIPTYLFLIALLLNIVARSSTSFSDFYISHIFPIWEETYGRLTGLFPFSVGELLLYLGVILIFLLIIGGGSCIIRRQVPKWYQHYSNVCVWIISIVCMIMTLNCTILYHGSVLTVRYDIGTGVECSYGYEEIAALRNYIVKEANALSETFERDKDGYIIDTGDMKKQSKAEIRRLSEEFDCLKGYCSSPKEFLASDFFSQQYMMGYYFPFTLEANYNGSMYIVNIPATMCHELSHLKGIIREDEANFLAYLACVDSEDSLFRYSAYLSVLTYVERDFKKAYTQLGEGNADDILEISELVLFDDMFLTREAWDKVEEGAVFSTDFVKEVSNSIVETNLNINGISDGRISYSRVVNLLLQYYDGIL